MRPVTLTTAPRQRRMKPLYTQLSSSSSNNDVDSPPASTTDDTTDILLCDLGTNTVQECVRLPATQSQFAATTNLAKCICGAGSFALPHVFLQQGLLGGTLALSVCGGLAAVTMQSLADSRARVLQQQQQSSNSLSYVQLAEQTLGTSAAQLVFTLTMCAALGVCSTYLVFIGQTLESMALDGDNLVHNWFPSTSEWTFELVTAILLVPLCLIRDYSIFAWTSAVGVAAVVGGMAVTLASGIWVEPGLGVALEAWPTLRLWPESLAVAFGTSFGTIAYLFCINFLTFPILNSMKEPSEYGGAVNRAVGVVWAFNVIFAIGCLAFYGDETQDLVLGNLGNGPFLSALKLFLCVDLLFTFPIVFSSGRQILENAVLEQPNADENAVPRAVLVTGAVSACLGLAQIGGFGAVANLVGGVAQGTLAFILPPAIAVTLARRSGNSSISDEVVQWALGAFGVMVVSAVTYFTIDSMMVPS